MNTATAPSSGMSASTGVGTLRLVLNFLLFQGGWFACVWGAANRMAVAGTIVAGFVVTLHLLCAARPRQELKLVAVSVLIGAMFDSCVLATGVVQFPSGSFVFGLAPCWILALWSLFATTLNITLCWLRGRWLLAMVLGAIAGPISYWAGVKLGAVIFVRPLLAVTEIAVEWAIAMPLLMYLAQRFDGIHTHAAGVETIHA